MGSPPYTVNRSSDGTDGAASAPSPSPAPLGPGAEQWHLTDIASQLDCISVSLFLKKKNQLVFLPYSLSSSG